MLRTSKKFSKTLIRSGMVSLIVLSVATTSSAQSVNLTSEDGSINFSGDLVGFNGSTYTIETSLGAMNIAVDMVSCSGEACPNLSPATGDFRIVGSDTIGVEMMPLLIKGYAQSLGGEVESENIGDRLFMFTAIGDEGLGEDLFTALVEDKGSSTGFRALLAGEADIGMSSRQIRRAEVQAFRENGLGDPLSFEQELTLAADGLMIVVHPDIPIDALAEEQIGELLSGQIDNWSAIGGPDLPVTVVSRDSNSGTFGTISARFLEPIGADLAPGATIVTGNEAMTDTVFQTPGAIGYAGFAFKGDTKPLGLISSCGLTARPTPFGVKTGEYPLARNLYLYLTDNPLPGSADAFLEYALSPEAVGLIEKSGFFGFDVSGVDQSDAANSIRSAIEANTSPSEQALMREMFIDLLEWERLSTTFRFRSGSAALDNASRRDLATLVDYLADLPRDKQISIVGFTDSDGSFDANRTLGFSRAESIRNEIVATAQAGGLNLPEFSLKSFGELNPTACNTDFAGQRQNRRVEIWQRG